MDLVGHRIDNASRASGDEADGPPGRHDLDRRPGLVEDQRRPVQDSKRGYEVHLVILFLFPRATAHRDFGSRSGDSQAKTIVTERWSPSRTRPRWAMPAGRDAPARPHPALQRGRRLAPLHS